MNAPMLLFAYFTLPLVAFGAAVGAAAVPILIHLLSKQRQQVVPWAAIRFLQAAQKQQNRRLDRWLLLLARILCLLLPLLAMIAATPWAESIWQRIRPGQFEAISNAPRTHRILVIDASMSMSTLQGDQSRFDYALQKAETAINDANPGDGFTLIVLDGSATTIVPGPSNDASTVIEELQSLKVTHGTSSLSDGIAAVWTIVQQSPRTYPRKQVLLFTDMQRSAWSGLLARDDGTVPEIWKKLLPRAEVNVIDCGEADVANISISNFSLLDPLPLVGAENAATIVVRNYGTQPLSQVAVELAMGQTDGKRMLSIGQQLIDTLPADGQQSVTFRLPAAQVFASSGRIRLQARLVRPDALLADDQRSLCVEVRDRLQVVLVNGLPNVDPLRSSAGYLAQALTPGGKPSPLSPFETRVLSPTEFADPILGDLTNVSCVVLCDVPVLGPSQLARLRGFVERGGGLILGLGPNIEANRDLCNATFFNDNLFPGSLGETVEAESAEKSYRLYATEKAYREMPLVAFRGANARAGLTSVPFRKFMELSQSEARPVVALLSFVLNEPEALATDQDKKSVANASGSLVESRLGRGRMFVYTSSFNTAWTEWPVLPSFLPFVHQLTRLASLSVETATIEVGEPINEYFPSTSIGLTATLETPDGRTFTTPIVASNSMGVAHFSQSTRAGIYELQVGRDKVRSIAVNPISGSVQGDESNLRRLASTDLERLGKITISRQPSAADLASDGDTYITLIPKPHGPTIARWLVTAGIVMLILELLLAWRLGPARSSSLKAKRQALPSNRSLLHHLLTIIGGLATLLVLATCLLLAVVGTTGSFDFLPETTQRSMETALGVPQAAPGEGTVWGLATSTAYVTQRLTDQRILLGILLVGVVVIGLIYNMESRVVGRRLRLLMPVLLRVSALLLLIVILLQQVRLTLDRVGWPDVAVLVDTSASMGNADPLTDPAIQAKVDALLANTNVGSVTRLRIAKLLLGEEGDDILGRLLRERQFKIHIYSIDSRLTPIAQMEEPDSEADLDTLEPIGDVSRLGDCVEQVLKQFRGGSLAAIIVCTDGIVTEGRSLEQAGQSAAQAGVPLFLVGIGDARDPPDVILSDLKADETVYKDDTLILQARVTLQGKIAASSVPVILSERQGEQLVERSRATVQLDPTGMPVNVELKDRPATVGEKSYVITIPRQPGEMESGNNQLEKRVLVTDTRQLRVLLVDGYPRYEFRYLKAYLEREAETGLGKKSIDLRTLLLDASPGYADQDKTALRSLPTRSELFEYDVVILGDVDPTQLPRASGFFESIAEFVTVRGGGVALIAGNSANPDKLFDTPLKAILPVESSKVNPVESTTTLTAEANGYAPQLTPLGSSHPLFQFGAELGSGQTQLNNFPPLLWAASGYQAKASAEVLATHPNKLEERFPSEKKHPLILQQFAGSGRVLFLGMDETWRWRFRTQERWYNQFWTQLIRTLARTRVAQAELRTDKQTSYRQGEPIRLSVRFPDDAPAPSPEVNITVAVERRPIDLGNGQPPQGTTESTTVKLSKVEGERALYETLLTRTPVGGYRFYLNDVLGNDSSSRPRAEAKVLPPPGELDRLELDRAAMESTATTSRGHYYTLPEATELVADIPDVARLPVNKPMPPLTLWNHAGVFLLMVLLLALEWWLRRDMRLL